MKKKVVVALVAAMSLTVAGTGTVFAMNKVSTIASEKEHVHGDNCEYIVDKEAWDEVINHPEIGHFETQTIPAWDEVVQHPEEGHFETQRVVVKEAWDEVINHPEEGHYESVTHCICNGCGMDFGKADAEGVAKWEAHSIEQEEQNGNLACGGWHDEKVEEWVVDKEAWQETIHHDAIYEDKEVWIVDKQAWTETIHHPEETKEIWVVDKEAWSETIHHPEEGHWVCNGEPEQKPEKPDQKPEQPEKPDQKPDQKPEQPENPDQKPEQPENPEQKPEQPENPDVETPETPDTENSEVPEQKPEAPTTPEANKENVQTQETETKKEGTSPKTGDTASALPVAGVGVASLGVALATILKKRK